MNTQDLLVSIEPGADPRGGWQASGDGVMEHWRLRDDGVPARHSVSRGRAWKHRRHYVEVHRQGHPQPYFDTLRYTDPWIRGVRYVPFDVARWRDPAHREALALRGKQRRNATATRTDR